MWLLLGSAFVVGGGGPLLADIQTFLPTRTLDSEGFKIGVFCSLAILAGLAGLMCWRILVNMQHPPQDHGRILWNLLARIGMPLGALTVEFEWGRTMSIPTTYNQKALLLAGGFTFLAGLLALIGERVVLHLRELAQFHAEYAPAARHDVPANGHAEGAK